MNSTTKVSPPSAVAAAAFTVATAVAATKDAEGGALVVLVVQSAEHDHAVPSHEALVARVDSPVSVLVELRPTARQHNQKERGGGGKRKKKGKKKKKVPNQQQKTGQKDTLQL